VTDHWFAWILGDLGASPVASVMDVPAGTGPATYGAYRHLLVGEQFLQDIAGLTAHGDAQGDRGAERCNHAGLPDALPAWMQVQFDGLGLPLDRHGEQRGRREHHHAITHH
jgi:hypothetical protein